MNLQLTTTLKKLNASITISGSKSESNRLLILQKLYPNIQIQNLSDSDDSVHLQHALFSNEEIIDIGHAGTAMRFLTAFFATKNTKNVVLTGSERMQNRPIKILADALQELGATISYVKKKGYPPINIQGKELTKNYVKINGNVSSQYISALMLIAPHLKNGLTVELLGNITSVPYINMTLQLLQQLGIDAVFNKNYIRIKPKKQIKEHNFVVESDWSSASYFYSLVAMSDIGSKISLSSYKQKSLQGDSCLSNIYKQLGVYTSFNKNTIVLTKEKKHQTTLFEENLIHAPDIAQTITITCFGLGIACNLTGLHTLKIKETDRLEALKTELRKLGATISVTNNSLHLKPRTEFNKNTVVATYNDHRMAMAFAPLALLTPIHIANAEVVSKSYQNFWKDLQGVGFQIIKIN